MVKKEIKLKVVEAYQDDVNKGIVRIDSSFMKEIGIKQGDIVEIEGDRRTVAIADRAFPGDIGLNIIRMDGIVRRNAKTGIGEFVKITQAEAKEAKKVTIAPAKRDVIIKASPRIFKEGLLGRALVKGDIISLGGTGRRKTALSESPFFNDIFDELLNENFLGFGFGGIKFIVTEALPKQPVVIVDSTEVSFNPEGIEEADIEETAPEVSYEDIGGLTEEIKKIREMVELPLKHPEIFERLGIEPPKGVLLHGTPGTGKTLLAKAVASETQSHFITINGPEIMSKFYGQSEENLRKKFEEAEKNAPSIVFIDEIDAIASKREEAQGEVERRVVAQLLALMDGLQSRGKVVVIGATNIPNALDPALRRPGRFDREIEIGVPSKEGRLNILKIHTRNMPLGKKVNLKHIAEVTHGYVGADVAALAKEAAMIVLRRVLPDFKLNEEEAISKEVLEKLVIGPDDMKNALKVVRPSALREVFVEIPNVQWKDIGGLEEVKQELKESVEWPLRYPQAFERIGIRPPRGILLYGAPGTGKTMLAKAVANESQANFILVKGPEMLSKWVGESEKGIRKIFRRARQVAPTILFFDEIDSIAPTRSAASDSPVTERVVNQLLTEIDGLEDLDDIVIIGATNRPDIIDTSFLRPGRFDRIILTSPPNEKARLEILKVHLQDVPIDKDVKIKELAAKTEGYTGADLESVVREAGMLALRNDIKAESVTSKNFDEALKKVRPSVTKEIEQTYAEIKDHFTAAKAKQMREEKPAYMG